MKILAATMSTKKTAFSDTRRAFIASVLAGMALGPARIVLSADEEAPSTKEAKFRRDLPEGHKQSVQISVDVTGQLKLNADGKEVRKLPMLVKGSINYVERQLAPVKSTTKDAPASIARWARHYGKATATITINDQPMEQGLREDRRLFAINNETASAVLFSPMGPLTREELELVDVPFGTTYLGRLLPKSTLGTGIGSSWKLTDNDVAALLCLDNVSQHDISVTLKEIAGGDAKASIEGKAQGAVAGVSTEMDISATFNYTLAKQQVTWLNASISEDRAIGHAQPGYVAQTKLKIIIDPTETAEEVSDKALGDLPTTANVATTLIDFQSSEAKFELAHDRRWRTMADAKDLAIMRMIDHGDLIAQCNISRLPPLPKGSQLTLEGFQADIRKSLAKSFGQFIEAGQSVNDRGQRILRVIVTGMASELPIHWAYYHVSDEAGNRAVIVVTLEMSLVEKYPALDTQILAGFNFIGTPVVPAATPTTSAGSAGNAAAAKDATDKSKATTPAPRSATKPTITPKPLQKK